MLLLRARDFDLDVEGDGCGLALSFVCVNHNYVINEGLFDRIYEVLHLVKKMLKT